MSRRKRLSIVSRLLVKFLTCSLYPPRNDPFVWDLAEALLWRDEEVSMAAIPRPIREQPEADKYYDDALYIIKYLTKRVVPPRGFEPQSSNSKLDIRPLDEGGIS